MMKYSLLLIAVLFVSFLDAQPSLTRDPKITAYHKRAMGGIKPDYKKLVTNTSTYFTNHSFNSDSLKAALRKNSLLASLSVTDIETLMVLVMLETSEQMAAELRQLSAEMKEQNSSKKSQRNSTSTSDSSRTSTGGSGDKDSLNEMSQEKMFRMRQLTEEKDRLERMISNMLRKLGATESNISDNLKA